MPEYLAPAVYVEEVDTGSKPIEGVSTSTTGFVGVAERGPVNVPILVTSAGEYQRWFGQSLDPLLYGTHCFLPHAVDGFFTNGGKRVFITRVLEIDQALAANRQLVAPDPAAPPQAQLITAAAPGAGSIVIDANPGLAAPDTLQIGDGINADFQAINPIPPIAAAVMHGLRAPLVFDHTAGASSVPIVDGAPAADHGTTLAFAVAAGADGLIVNPSVFNPALAVGDLLRVGTTGNDEDLAVVAGPIVANRIPLNAPLRHAHASGVAVRRQTLPGPIVGPVASGSAVTAGASAVHFAAALAVPAGSVLRFDAAASPQVEYRRVGALTRLPLEQPASAEFAAGSVVERLPGLGGVVRATQLSTDAAAGATVIRVDRRESMVAGQLLRIGVGPLREFVEILDLPSPTAPPDAGNIVLRAPLRNNHLAVPATPVDSFAMPGPATLQSTVVLPVAPGAPTLVVADAGYAAADVLRVRPASGGAYFHAIGAPVALAPMVVPLVNPLVNAQVAGATVARRRPMVLVRALDAGRWGNRLRVGMEPQDEPLLSTRVRQVLLGGRLRLDSAAGLEAGTELVFGVAAPNRAKVRSIDRDDDSLVELDGGALPAGVVVGTTVRSQEHRFVVELLRQPDPANPSRNGNAIDREVFAALSLDPRHSRYFQSVIGATWNIASNATTTDDGGRALRRGDRRSEGESRHVRVLDLAPTQALRPGAVFTRITPPGGVPRLLLLPLGGGNDVIAGIGDDTYIGQPDPNPELRTGLYTLDNIEEISIVAIPGVTTAKVQNALINHCEQRRYRFAVLDGAPPPHDSMTEIQLQRQRYDTKYAALYHPWLLVPDPYPDVQGPPPDYPIPPSGHMAGIYARTDIERGVHKAPANEVVRGVIGLQRVLNKEQHDILNPYPVNINVIRDFRPVNRGIRIYGGRCITSDSDWKYVNVRRLLIFIEASVDRGLQWVVFEPNAEPLWARVRRSITNFLTLVWRNGALEGTKVEEAFFVKCDRTTMTQTDIDQGRLICLVGVAPVKPAEYVIVRIGLWTAHADE
ncbi:MAG: phage tail sheath subtilisin-like domain-containing protein [Rubrivivax sp.]|nr:phage tail sheath subtilisin-like domain-containing protein [Rubrivivax sp.]